MLGLWGADRPGSTSAPAAKVPGNETGRLAGGPFGSAVSADERSVPSGDHCRQKLDTTRTPGTLIEATLVLVSISTTSTAPTSDSAMNRKRGWTPVTTPPVGVTF
jgi:hypothetical protein